MNVGELIEKLKDKDPSLIVGTVDADYGWEEIDDVSVETKSIPDYEFSKGVLPVFQDKEVVVLR